MAAVSQAFSETQPRLGSVIGIIPSGSDTVEPKLGYPNPWVEIPIFTHLPLSGIRGTDPLSRNHVNVLSSDVLIALPGGAGTTSEVRLALAYGRPIVAFVSSTEQIPGLSTKVPCRATLQQVAEFVQARLGERLRGRREAD
jgi:predicted Rossmann-fold nucleotide-binding protein